MSLTVGILSITPCLQKAHTSRQVTKWELQNKMSHSTRVRFGFYRSSISGRNRGRVWITKTDVDSEYARQAFYALLNVECISFHIPSNLSRRTRLRLIAFFLMLTRCLSETKDFVGNEGKLYFIMLYFNVKRKPRFFPRRYCIRTTSKTFLRQAIKINWNVSSVFYWLFFSRYYYFPFVSSVHSMPR